MKHIFKYIDIMGKGSGIRMDINKMPKTELEKILIRGIEDSKLKQAVIERIIDLDNQGNLEHIEIIKSMDKKLESIDGVLDVIAERFSSAENLNSEQLEEIQFLIKEMKDIMEDSSNREKEGSIGKVLKKGIDMGSQVAIPLLVEYIKLEYIKRGIL